MVYDALHLETMELLLWIVLIRYPVPPKAFIHHLPEEYFNQHRNALA